MWGPALGSMNINAGDKHMGLITLRGGQGFF